MRIIAFAILLIFIAACQAPEANSSATEYFDIEKYNDEISSDLQRIPIASKTVKLNELEETQELKDYILSSELEMMNRYNINKTSLAGKYKEEKNGQSTIYSALEDGLRTRRLSIEKNNKDVTRIEINGFQKSVLSESTQTIIYVPNKSFRLISEDKNRFTKDLKKEVLIRF